MHLDSPLRQGPQDAAGSTSSTSSSRPAPLSATRARERAATQGRGRPSGSSTSGFTASSARCSQRACTRGSTTVYLGKMKTDANRPEAASLVWAGRSGANLRHWPGPSAMMAHCSGARLPSPWMSAGPMTTRQETLSSASSRSTAARA